VRSPERPRRFVSDGRGGGYWTHQTPEEEADADRLAKQQRDAQLAQSLAWHPSLVAERQAEREAAQQRAFDQQWPNPRQSLRNAHDELRAADATLAKHRDQSGAASAHVAERAAGVERAQSEVETVRREQTARLRAQLAGNGGAIPDGADDPAEAAAMRAAERARRLLVLAKSAQADIEVEVEEAQGEVRRAQAQVEKAAQALIEKTRRDVEADWAAAQQRVAELQAQLFGLRIDPRYSSASWRPNLRKLLVDPEAPLIEDEIKIEPAVETETA
jgi:hypothetical protein